MPPSSNFVTHFPVDDAHYWWTRDALALLIGQVLNRRLSTASEWVLSLDMILFFLTFFAEFMRINFDAPALKSCGPPVAHVTNSVPA